MRRIALVFLLGCSSKPATFVDASMPPPVEDAGTMTDADLTGMDVQEAGPKPVVSHVTGTVYAPEGTIPISGALVYLTNKAIPPIPTALYCDSCVQLTKDTPFALSKPDGTFDIAATDLGTQKLVVQKGGFRRVRTINVTPSTTKAPAASTTLPQTIDTPKGDETPRMAVFEGWFDAIEVSLKRLGLVEKPGVFDILPDTSALFNWNDLQKYHIIFLPCTDDSTDSTQPAVQQNLQDFVAKGGRAYVTDWSYDYVTQVWPPYISLIDQTNEVCSACGGAYDANATVQDMGLKNWLTAQNINMFLLEGNFTKIDKVNSVMTTDKNNKPVTVKPKVWVTGDVDMMQRPTTISFERACGRVLFSTYHTENGNSMLTPQERALLYILLEVSVCVDSDTGVVVGPN